MATVRFSNELINDIKRKAKAPFDVKKREIEVSKNFDSWADPVWDTIMGPHKEAVLSLPPGWMDTTNRFNMRLLAGQRYIHIYVNATREYPMPGELRDNPHLTMLHNGYLQVSEDSTVFAPLIEEVREWVAAKDAVDTQCNVMLHGINQLTNTYSTLGPALKAWPALWELLPEYAKTKHKDVVKREKVEPKELKADLGAMTAALTVQKMMGKL
jgi:hypothetical protein